MAKVNFLSIEPLLGHMDKWSLANVIRLADWIIIGVQTKPTVMPKIEWVREIVEACDKAGVKVFLRDSLFKLLPIDAGHFYHAVEDGDHYQLRQEMPE